MKSIKKFLCVAFCTALFAAPARADMTDDDVRIAAAPVIPVPAGYGRYCSLSYASGDWAFAFVGAGADPCADMLKSTPGGTIQRAGLYSVSGPNNVVYRCNTGVGLLKGNGQAILKQAYDDSKGKKNCVFTVAPKAMPLFDAPFPLATPYSWGRGVDFARGYSAKGNDGVEHDDLNYKGNVSNYRGHDGWDVNMPAGTPVKAMADGLVIAARDRDIQPHIDAGGCPSGSTRLQKEIYVLHVVGTGAYRELFVAYFAHFVSHGVKAGARVSRGDFLGASGTSGCSSGPHLHVTVSRFSNTATQYRRDFSVPKTEDYEKDSIIDAFGFSWTAKAGFDPWAWRAFEQGKGALSIGLWRAGQAFKRD